MAVLEELTSADGWHKVAIVERTDGLLQIQPYSWYRETVPEHDFEDSGWLAMPGGRQLTDSVDIARTLAREWLSRIGQTGRPATK